MINDCIFCKISSGKISSEKIFEDDNFFVINDLNPVSEGHCLIISKKHFETILDLPIALGSDLVKVVKSQVERLLTQGLADGVKIVQNNFEASGQTVKHFHVHIIPEKLNVKREKHV